MLSRLRQRRYVALTALMLVVAAICIAAGTWQVNRFEWKVRSNNQLRGNAHRAAAPVTDVLTTTAAGRAPADNAVKFRTVTATGSYDTAHQSLVPGQSIDTTSGDDDSMGGDTGYLVVTPFKTPTAYLLVVRGFLAPPNNGSVPAPPPPPTGTVTIVGRVEPGATKNDKATQLPDAQVLTINPTEQASRIGSPVFSGYAELLPGQPGINGLTAVPAPSLANPAGGAQEWQHLAYIIQWYLFALLALLAPLLVSRHEAREAQRRFLGIDPDARPELQAGGASGAIVRVAGKKDALAVRDRGALAVRSPAEQARIEQATAMADRYGLRLEVPDGPLIPVQEPPPDPVRDEFHGSYNDYLWQLAMADGEIPPAAPQPPSE